MSTEKPASKPPKIEPKKKKKFVSIPFVIIVLALIGIFIPILPDSEFDEDTQRESVVQNIMFRFMASEEQAKANAAATKNPSTGKGSGGVGVPISQDFGGRPDSDDED